MLGAFGCGAFRNPPEVVARIFREELEKVHEMFEVVAFPVINLPGFPDNVEVFREAFLDEK